MTQTTYRIAHTIRTFTRLFPSTAAIDAEMTQMTAQRALRGAPAPTRDEAVMTIIAADKLALHVRSVNRAEQLTDRVGRRR